MAESFVQVAPDSTGKLLRTRNRTVGANSIHEQYVIQQEEKVISNFGRAGTYRITGRAPAAGANQILATVFNASAAVLVRVNRVVIDGYDTAARAVGTPPALLRAARISAAPTGGTALVKSQRDTIGTSDANVTLLGDASADGTNSTTALAATLTAGSFLVQEAMSRILANTGTGATTTTPPIFEYEPADRIVFFNGEPDIILRQTQGLALFVNAPAAGSVPATSFFVVTIDWDEYTLP